MKQSRIFNRKPLLLVLTLTGAVGLAGAAGAQQYPSANPNSPSTAASPSSATGAGAMHPGATANGMSTPSRNESADSAWQKIGSKGYVTKDDVKDLHGFSFETADANHDGRLTQDEFRKGWSSYASQSSTTPSAGTSSSKTSGTTKY